MNKKNLQIRNAPKKYKIQKNKVHCIVSIMYIGTLYKLFSVLHFLILMNYVMMNALFNKNLYIRRVHYTEERFGNGRTGI